MIRVKNVAARVRRLIGKDFLWKAQEQIPSQGKYLLTMMESQWSIDGRIKKMNDITIYECIHMSEEMGLYVVLNDGEVKGFVGETDV